MYGENDDKKFTQLQCLDRKVVDLSTGVWIDEYYFEYECNSYKSGAATLAVGAASLLVAASLL